MFYQPAIEMENQEAKSSSPIEFLAWKWYIAGNRFSAKYLAGVDW